MKEKTITIPHINKKIKAYFYSKKDGLFTPVAQVNPWTGRLEINEAKLNSCTKETSKFILVHEYRHTKQSPLPIAWPIFLFFVLSLYFNFHEFYTAVITLIVFLIVLLVFSWILEIDANLYALGIVGKTHYDLVIKEVEDRLKRASLLKRMVRSIIQPPPIVFNLPLKIFLKRKR